MKRLLSIISALLIAARVAGMRIGLAAALAIVAFVGVILVRPGDSSTASLTEVPHDLLALVDSLYSTDDFVATALADFYRPQSPTNQESNYLDGVWDAVSGEKP